jgi:RHS repeat-associated protein
MLIARKALALTLIVGILIGPCGSASAATHQVAGAANHLDPFILFLNLLCPAPGKDVDTKTGGVSHPGPEKPPPGGSPSIPIAAVFNSSNLSSSVWGRGWFSDTDQSFRINTDSSVTMRDGSGAQLTFFKTGTDSSGAPLYAGPQGVYLTLTASTWSNGLPTSLSERESDGTTLLFAPIESPSILRFKRLTDRNGNTVDYTRDSQGRVTHIQDVHGRYFDIAYNASGLVSTVSDSAGRTFGYQYDAQDRRTSQTGPEGTTGYAYDANNRLTTITYPNGGVRNYTYDSQGRVLTQDDGQDANNQTANPVSYAYYASSTVMTDVNGNTVYEFTDRSGLKRLTKVTDPLGHVTSYSYDAAFNPASETDALNRTTQYGYDAQGNVISVIDPAGGTSRAAYEPVYNMPTSLTDPLNRTARLSYDAKGNLTQATDPQGNSTSLGYDQYGHVTSVKDPLNQTSQFTYDASNGALASVTDPLSQTAQFRTDALSRVVQNTDPKGKVTKFGYDQAGDLLQVTDAMAGKTYFDYMPGRTDKLLDRVTDALGHSTSFAYDKQGRLLSVTNALGQSSSVSYDQKGRPYQVTTRDGQPISLDYYPDDRLKMMTLPEGQISLVYDDVGNLTSASKYNGSALSMSYDGLNRPTQVNETLPGGYQANIGYTYDANGNRTSMTTPWGSFRYTYDALNRVTGITNPEGKTVSFAYDSAGRRTKMTYPNGVVTTYKYDTAGQVTEIKAVNAANGTVVALNDYTYDANGNRTSMTDLDGTHTYTYDDLNRLTAAHHPAASGLPVLDETFSYDAVGNRMSDAERTDYTYDGANRLVSDSSDTYSYDANGNLTSSTNTVTGEVRTYVYDTGNQLVAVAASTYTIATYKYDPAGRRIVKDIRGNVTQYVYDGTNIVATLDGSNSLQQVFTQGPGIDDPLMMRNSGRDYFYSADGLGSAETLTNSSGIAVEGYKYQAYGRPTFTDGSGTIISQSKVANSLLYSGRELDHVTGLYYFRARYLNADAGRFLSEDSIPSVNSYFYANDNPINYRDLFGLASGNASTLWNSLSLVSNIVAVGGAAYIVVAGGPLIAPVLAAAALFTIMRGSAGAFLAGKNLVYGENKPTSLSEEVAALLFPGSSIAQDRAKEFEMILDLTVLPIAAAHTLGVSYPLLVKFKPFGPQAVVTISKSISETGVAASVVALTSWAHDVTELARNSICRQLR